MSSDRYSFGRRSEARSALDPLAVLRAAAESVDSEPIIGDKDVSEFQGWLNTPEVSAAIRSVFLSDGTLSLLGVLIPDASVTDARIARIEARRKAANSQRNAIQELETRYTARSPGELVRELRASASVSSTDAAHALDVSEPVLFQLEAGTYPWFRLDPSIVPRFAALVKQPAERFLALLTITARRSIVSGVQRRVALSLGRFDKPQVVREARMDTLRMAFARLAEENRGAGEFIARSKAALQSGGEPSQ